MLNRLLLLTLCCLARSVAGNELDLRDIKLPPGFEIEVYADVPNARSMAVGYNDVIFVSNRIEDSVYAVVPTRGEPARDRNCEWSEYTQRHCFS
jgi:hypothetical protein